MCTSFSGANREITNHLIQVMVCNFEIWSNWFGGALIVYWTATRRSSRQLRSVHAIFPMWISLCKV